MARQAYRYQEGFGSEQERPRRKRKGEGKREIVLLIHLPRKKRIKVGKGSYRT